MPWSLPIFDDLIGLYFREARPPDALDIGAGAGKFGRLIRTASPQTRITGVEIDQQHVCEFGLAAVYDELIVADAASLIEQPRRRFTAVVIGDCIEHMRKSSGVDLLHFLVHRSGVIFVKFPSQLIQDDAAGPSEAHLSVWSEHDFAAFDHIYLGRDIMRLGIVRGYLSNAIEWLPQALMRKLGYQSCAEYYDRQPQRWDLADLRTRRREMMIADLRAIVSEKQRFILADEMKSDLWPWAGARAVPFLEKEGKYWGMPPDDAAAIAEIERQRAAGAAFIAFISPTTWALDHYRAMARHLSERYRCVIRDERTVVYDLR